MDDLFSPLKLGSYELSHRVVMAPLTRMRARRPANSAWELNAEYYRQRASEGGLLISEATQVALLGQAYPATPGIYTTPQVEGWRMVTDAVHSRGGLIFAQLWHVGRVSHSSYHGMQPVAPSAVRADVMVMNAEFERVPAQEPRALELGEISGVISVYRAAAENARAAGFDGVEIHGANGYLPDQFLQDGSNRRSDRYGGSFANRERFLLELVEMASDVLGAGKVGVRLSPFGTANDMMDSAPADLFSHVIQSLSDRGIAYLHLIEPRAGAGFREVNDDAATSAVDQFRHLFRGPIIASGGYTREDALQTVRAGRANAIAFGRHFISNPDLPRRLKLNVPLNLYDRSTFYGGAAEGYTDYPSLS